MLPERGGPEMERSFFRMIAEMRVKFYRKDERGKERYIILP